MEKKIVMERIMNLVEEQNSNKLIQEEPIQQKNIKAATKHQQRQQRFVFDMQVV